jgi:hypothetical protein
MNKNESKKLSNREIIKNNILKGKEYYSEQQIKDVFNYYYSQKNRREQNLFLNSLVIPVTNDQNIRQKFDYFIEIKNPKNEVFFV